MFRYKNRWGMINKETTLSPITTHGKVVVPFQQKDSLLPLEGFVKSLFPTSFYIEHSTISLGATRYFLLSLAHTTQNFINA
jgi:hypothetical protein